MKKYICPDCKNEFEEGAVPSICPNCGCPSNQFKIQEKADVNQVIFSNSDEKVYYFDKKVRISSKIWSLGGWDQVNTHMSGVMYIPVKSISSIVISRNWLWIFLLILALATFILSIFFLASARYSLDLAIFGLVSSLVSGLLIWLTLIVRNYRMLVIKPHNSLTQYTIHCKNPQDAKRYLERMLKCLQENS